MNRVRRRVTKAAQQRRGRLPFQRRRASIPTNFMPGDIHVRVNPQLILHSGITPVRHQTGKPAQGAFARTGPVFQSGPPAFAEGRLDMAARHARVSATVSARLSEGNRIAAAQRVGQPGLP